jgi:single-strand DNA-binding protein
MRTINKVILIGNITKDPFVKTTTGDKKVATFTVATNRYYK